MEFEDKNMESDEQDIARLLQAAGRREMLPEDLKGHWEQHFRQELSAVQASRRHGVRGGIFAVAAGLAVLAIGVTLLVRPPPVQALHVEVLAARGESRLENNTAQGRLLRSGDRLAASDVIRTGPGDWVALNYAGYDLRLKENTVLALEQDGVRLQRGEIYASDEDDRMGKTNLEVRTALGNIRDIGTQFTVQVSDDLTVTTVRRGAVILDAGAARHRSEATPGNATRITVNKQREVHSEPASPVGEAWAWIYQAAVPYTLEGQTALAFLQWSTGESGLQLEFSTPRARAYARGTTLHGDIGGMNPERALTPVLATTDLSATIDNGVLRVSLE